MIISNEYFSRRYFDIYYTEGYQDFFFDELSNQNTGLNDIWVDWFVLIDHCKIFMVWFSEVCKLMLMRLSSVYISAHMDWNKLFLMWHSFCTFIAKGFLGTHMINRSTEDRKGHEYYYHNGWERHYWICQHAWQFCSFHLPMLKMGCHGCCHVRSDQTPMKEPCKSSDRSCKKEMLHQANRMEFNHIAHGQTLGSAESDSHWWVGGDIILGETIFFWRRRLMW